MAGRKQCSRDRTRPLTHGPPQQTPPFEIHDLAGILRAAAAQNGASQRVADRGMLSRLIKPARSYLSCAWIDNLVVFVVLLSTDLRDIAIRERLGIVRANFSLHTPECPREVCSHKPQLQAVREWQGSIDT